MNSSRRPEWVLAAAVAIMPVAMGVRAPFGLFLQPMSVEQGWTREVFSLAFAIQSILWGIGAPVFGAMADRYGAGRTVEDLVQKAVGGWVREAGKKDPKKLLEFLDQYAGTMPRTTLRYATEHLSSEQKKHYMGLKSSKGR